MNSIKRSNNYKTLFGCSEVGDLHFKSRNLLRDSSLYEARIILNLCNDLSYLSQAHIPKIRVHVSKVQLFTSFMYYNLFS
jgi:hypothetical protein